MSFFISGIPTVSLMNLQFEVPQDMPDDQYIVNVKLETPDDYYYHSQDSGSWFATEQLTQNNGGEFWI